MTLKSLIFPTMRRNALLWMALLCSTAQACHWDLAVVKHHRQCSTLPCDTRSHVQIADEAVATCRKRLNHAIDELLEAEHREFLDTFDFVFKWVSRVPQVQTVHLAAYLAALIWCALLILCISLDFESRRAKSRHQTASDKLKAVDTFSVLEEVCPICYDDQDSWKQLPCGHVFHGACIERWFLERTICPNCTLDVLTMEQ